MTRHRRHWTSDNTDSVIEGVVIGVACALLIELGKLAIERLRQATEPKPVKSDRP